MMIVVAAAAVVMRWPDESAIGFALCGGPLIGGALARRREGTPIISWSIVGGMISAPVALGIFLVWDSFASMRPDAPTVGASVLFASVALPIASIAGATSGFVVGSAIWMGYELIWSLARRDAGVPPGSASFRYETDSRAKGDP